MSIDVVISTTTSQIVDTNGANGWGTVSVYPAQAFTYYDGSTTISVTGNATTVTVADGKFSSPTTVTLAPSKNASNNPETYYIVDIRVNGTFQRWLWSIPATPLAYEFTTVPRIASGNSTSNTVSELLNASDPFKQYVLRSDALDTPIAGTASDGRGYIPRGDTTNDNKLDPSWLGGSGSGGELTAADIPIVDAGGYYTGTDVEAALQEVGDDLSGVISASGNAKTGAGSGTLTGSYSTMATATLTKTGTYLIIVSIPWLIQVSGAVAVDYDFRLQGACSFEIAPAIFYATTGAGGEYGTTAFHTVQNVASIGTPQINLQGVDNGGDLLTFTNATVTAIRIGDPT